MIELVVGLMLRMGSASAKAGINFPRSLRLGLVPHA